MELNPALVAQDFNIAGARVGRELKVPGAEQNKMSIYAINNTKNFLVTPNRVKSALICN
jgi:hypothetical protein